ncbi:hypothetical protein VPH35_011953 [Triticum aestivum]
MSLQSIVRPPSALSPSHGSTPPEKVPGGGRGPGLRTPCASFLMLNSLVVAVVLYQAMGALDGSCIGASGAHRALLQSIARGVGVRIVQPRSSAPRMRAFHVFPYSFPDF